MAGMDAWRLDRRSFLRASALTLVGTSAGLLAACAPQPTAPLPPAAATSAPAATAAPAATTAPAAPVATTTSAGAAAPTTAAAAPAQGKTRDLVFLLDIAPYGKHALFFAGLDHGDFAKAGFNVRFEAAQGSADAAQKIGAKAADLGFADTGSSILARAQGAAIKETFMVHYKNLMAIIALKSKGLNVPKDLEGKTIAATGGDAPRALLPGWAKINNFDASKVNLLTVEQPAKPATLVAGQADGAMDFYTAWPAYVSAAKQKNEEMSSILYADYGLDIYNNGVIAHEDTLKSDPTMVKTFLDALGRAMVWTVENPDDATTIFLKYNPALTKETARAQLQVAIDFLMVDEVKQHGIGPMSADKMQKTVGAISDNYKLNRPVTADEIYTNDFAPTGLIPKV